MTAPNDADRTIHAFLLEGPGELSEPLSARIRGEVHETRQRTGFRPWRTPSMPRTILLVASLTAVTVAVGAMLLAGSGGQTPVVSPAPSASAAASAVASAIPSPSVSPGPSPYPLAAGEAWIVLAGAENQVVLIRPDGSGRHDIPISGAAVADTPVWSPDGSRLVFQGSGDRGSQLWVIDADGTNLHQLTPTPAGCPDGLCTEAVNPAWSPDGRTIAYIAPEHQSSIFTRTALMLIDVATGTTTELYSTSDSGFGRPTWSPDGATIAFEIVHYAGQPESTAVKDSVIATIDARSPGGTPRTITKPAQLAGYPAWHPSEDLIVFRTNRLNNDTQKMLDDTVPSDVYTMHSDGSGQTQVTKNAVGGDAVRAPSWTPDGRILYSAYRPATQDEVLRLIDADGKNETGATGSTVTFGEGRWRPGT